jgi:hypothetical protein
MAATEGIRSSFSTQPVLHSPKLRIYEYLFLLNQKLQETVQILKQLEKCPWLRRDFLRSFQVEVSIQRQSSAGRARGAYPPIIISGIGNSALLSWKFGCSLI